MPTDGWLSACGKSRAEEMVSALYRGLLGRDPDEAGLACWAGQLESGTEMTAVFDAIRTGDEYHSRQAVAQKAAALREATAAWAREHLEQPLLIVDVGAQKLDDESDVYSNIAACGVPHRIIGFEPLEHRMEEARVRQGADHITFLPYFIGDGGSYTFYINQPDATSSLLPLNEAVTTELINLSHLRTERTEGVTTKTLDEALTAETTVDFLKLDIQGFELKTLQSASQVLRRTNVVHCEVFFAELYQGQPYFSELEQFMRQSGFTFVDFSYLCRYAYHGDHADSLDRLGWGDAVFLRNPQELCPKDLLAQSLIALFVYGKYSLAQSLARRCGLPGSASLASLLQQIC